jgi:hypothetical protein
MSELQDLYRFEGRAEVIAGEVVRLPLFGRKAARFVGRLARRLHEHQAGQGEVGTATLVYAVPQLPSGRRSFSPIVSWFSGTAAEEMSFIEGAPEFAVELREGNEQSMAAKRADYFQAGTAVVWEVDLLAETIHCYRRESPISQVFHRGDIADAEPAVRGWRLKVNDLFAEEKPPAVIQPMTNRGRTP